MCGLQHTTTVTTINIYVWTLPLFHNHVQCRSRHEASDVFEKLVFEIMLCDKYTKLERVFNLFMLVNKELLRSSQSGNQISFTISKQSLELCMCTFNSVSKTEV